MDGFQKDVWHKKMKNRETKQVLSKGWVPVEGVRVNREGECGRIWLIILYMCMKIE
jgi:hypothetical protein